MPQQPLIGFNQSPSTSNVQTPSIANGQQPYTG